MVIKHLLPRLLAGLSLFASATLLASAPPVMAGAPLDLSAYKGKVVYLDFWASWCHPCEQSFPYMEQLKSRYGPDGLVIIAVNVDHSRDRANSFLKRVGSDLTVVYDSEGVLAQRYKVHDMPTSLLIGRDGRIRYTHLGFHPEQAANYNNQVAELVHEN